MPHDGSLVLYKGRAGRVQRTGEKLDILLADGETAKVRLKDVDLLHSGPFGGFSELQPPNGEVVPAWELLAGTATTLPELSELIYGAYTPATAWASWQLVADGLYFRGTPDSIAVATPEELAARRAARSAEAAERAAWEAFLTRVRSGQSAADDARYLREVESLALGKSVHSRVLTALGREETPESAHALLLAVGRWHDTVNPYPARLEVNTSIPVLPLPALPDEPRRDLTHLTAYAIDDANTETPDDALSLDGRRLWVHVADPAAVVEPDSDLDHDARGRGASLYLPEGTIPMLPPAATELLGLGLTDVSPALSFGIDLDASDALAGVEIVPSWVRVTRQTYEAADEAIAAGDETLARLYALALAYRAERSARGAVTIDLPEVDIRVRNGEVHIKPVLALRSRTVVEEAMVRTGAAIAGYAIEHALTMPYAVQEAPETLPRAETLAEMYAVRRTLKPRRYVTVPAPHAGLGVAAYVQATSPMRRYLDLVAHQQLRAYLRGATVFDGAAMVARIGEVDAIGGALRQAERLSDQHWLLVYLRRHEGWQGEGTLVEKHGLSGTVLITELAYEARVHLPADLPLDSSVQLSLTATDLPRLDARFRVGPSPDHIQTRLAG